MTWSVGSVSVDDTTGDVTQSGLAGAAYDVLVTTQPEMIDHDDVTIRIVARSIAADQANAIVAPWSTYASPLQVHSQQFNHIDLTAASTSETLDSATQLPANARPMGVEVLVSTPFTGGGAGIVTLSVGDAVSLDALVASARVHVAVDGQAQTTPLGTASHKKYTSATTLKYTFATNVNVAALSAGVLTVNTLYVEHTS